MPRYVIAAVLAAGLGAGLTAAFDTQDAGSSPSSPVVAASEIPEPHGIRGRQRVVLLAAEPGGGGGQGQAGPGRHRRHAHVPR